MKTNSLSFLYGCFSLLLLCVTNSENVYAQSFLRTNGTDIVDESGNKVFLRGVGLGNWMLPEGYMWKFGKDGDRPRRIEKIVSDCIGQEKANEFWKSFRKHYITEADIRRIAELGYNSVRPALNSRLFVTEGENNEFIDEGFQLLDNLISWCKKYKLYVIIDMHGAPGGQTGQNIDDSPDDEPELYMDPKNQDLLEQLWVKIAERYKDEPIVAAYDLLNEPLPENTGAADRYKHLLVPVYERLIKAIRAVDQKHMITLEGYNWSNNWSLFDKPLDPNVFYQFHYYCWDRPDNLNDISYFLERRKKLNTPVWVGETGEKNNTIYFATTQYFEKHNIGWSFWPWKKMETINTPYSIKAPAGWEAITAYSRGKEKPDPSVNAEKIFNDLIENIKLENCVYFPDVVNAMFRRLPLKVEAENFGHDGYGNSYYVKDTASKSAYYRKKEPVQVKVFGNNNTEQATELSAGEWTSYRVKSLNQNNYSIVLRAKAIQTPAEVTIKVNGKKHRLSIAATDFTEMKIEKASFKTGENQLQLLVNKGIVQADWMDIR
jgi:endoglucanase